MKELIAAIKQKHSSTGIVVHPPATIELINDFERKCGFELPADFREFYLTCNGFECNEDLFTFLPLEAIHGHEKDYGPNWFHFSEYMIYSDAWSLRKTQDGIYEIYNDDREIILTTSLHEFLSRFHTGNVFDKGGLYEWQDEKA